MRREITGLIAGEDATFLHVIATREDARAYECFFAQLISLYQQLTERPTTRNLAQLVGNNLHFIFVTQGTNLIASATLVLVKTATVSKGYIEDVVVNTIYRKLHIGEIMLEEAVKLGKARGCRYLQLTSKPKRPGTGCFYAKVGFELIALAKDGHPEATHLYRYYL